MVKKALIAMVVGFVPSFVAYSVGQNAATDTANENSYQQ